MNKRNLVLGSVLGMSLLGLLGAGVASAHGGGEWCHSHRGGYMSRLGGHGVGGLGMEGSRELRHVMRRLDLSQSQRDQIFQIRYQEIPSVREKMEALRHDRQELRAATLSANYDPQKVREAADHAAKTLSDLIVMRSETFRKMYGVLTPEQQAKVDHWKEKWGHRHHE